MPKFLQQAVVSVLICICLNPAFAVVAQTTGSEGAAAPLSDQPTQATHQKAAFSPTQGEPLLLLLLGLAVFIGATTAKRKKSILR